MEALLQSTPPIPYKTLRTVYEARASGKILRRCELPPYLRVRRRAGDGAPGLYVKLVSRDPAAHPEARAEALRNAADERIHDFKEFGDLAAVLELAAAQDRDPAIRRIRDEIEGGRP